MKNQDIEAYLAQPNPDYYQGVDLLDRYGNRSLARSYRNATPRFYLPKVLAALRKLALSTSSSSAPTPIATPSAQRTTAIKRNEPQIISRAKAKLHELYVSMAKLQRELVDLGMDNSEETKAKRRDIARRRTPIVKAFDELLSLKQQYFAEGEKDIPPRIAEILAELDGAPTPHHQRNELPDIKSMPSLKLDRLRHAIGQKITRRQNQLRYQCDVPTQQLSEMPQGPKRSRIEAEIRLFQQQIDIIKAELASRNL